MSCRSLTGRPVLLAHLATTILILTGERASAASRIENGLSAAAARSSADGVDSFLRGAVEEDLETSARATSDVTKGQVPRGSTRSATPWADSELDDDITANIHKSADSSATASASCVPEKLNAAGSKHDGKSKTCVLGVVLELLSCVGSNVGLVIEKQALMAEQNRLGKADVSATKLPLWWLGFAIFAVAQVVTGVALYLCSVVVIAPLSSFSLVINVFTSVLWLKEPTSVIQVVSSLAIVLGCVLTTIYAPWSKAKSSLECFRVYVGASDFHIVAAILLSTLAAVMVTGRALVLPSQRRTTEQPEWPRSARFGRWLYPIAAGMTAVWTINSGAALMRLLGWAMQGHAEVMKSYEVYLTTALYVLLIIMWQKLMNDCLIVLNAAFVVPINFALFTMLTLPVSGALHGTLNNWHPDAGALSMYCGGMAVCILGMCGLVTCTEGDKPKRVETEDAASSKQAAMEEKESSSLVSN